MNERRLKHLIEILESPLPDGVNFHMEYWCSSFISDAPDCGTVCCALGLACQDSTFMKEGLSIRKTQGGKTPHYNDSWGYFAGGSFFELTLKQTLYIFDPVRYNDAFHIERQDVIDHINNVLNGVIR